MSFSTISASDIIVDDYFIGCLPITCQVPIIAHITLEIHTHCTHAFNLKRIEERIEDIKTQCRSGVT